MKPLFALFSILLLAACAQEPPVTLQPLDFKQSAMSIKVRDVRVDENYRPPLMRPNVEHEFPTPLMASIGAWTRDKFHAASTSGSLVVSVDDASVRETLLPKKTGIDGLLEGKPEARYDAKLNVTFRLYNGADPLAQAEATVTVTRSRTLKSNASPDERDRFYESLNHDMMKDFDAQATRQLKQYFAGYIR